MPRVVKRYANRKLYDTTTSRYVALDDIAALVRSGEDVEVTDNETGADLTAVTFAQIILEEERRKSDFLSLPLLKQLVRYGGDAIAGVTNRGIEAIGEMRELAGRRVSEIVNENARPAIDEVLTSSRKRIDALQRRVDEGLKSSVERLRTYPGIGAELQRLENRMHTIESRIKRLLARQNGQLDVDEDEQAPSSQQPPDRTAGGQSK